jgi:hypothetical protein
MEWLMVTAMQGEILGIKIIKNASQLKTKMLGKKTFSS